MSKVQEAIKTAEEAFINAYDPANRAFPAIAIYTIADGEKLMLGSRGLSKREFLAGMALQGMLANPTGVQKLVDRLGVGKAAENALASAALNFADALLSECDRSHSSNPPGSCL